MRLIVAGGRKYTDWEKVEFELMAIHKGLITKYSADSPNSFTSPPITEIVCGMCDQGILTYKEDLPEGRAIRVYGADGLGYRWAKQNKIPIAEFPADWFLFKRAAGPLRNGKMADYADALIAFPGTAGTSDMVNRAKNNGLIIFDRRSICQIQ